MELVEAKDGSNSAYVKGQLIHSKFSPLKEAEKFYKEWIKNNPINTESTIIILEPGLGYLLSLLLKEGVKNILVIFFSSETYNYCLEKGYLINIPHWNPESPVSIAAFIEKQLNAISISNIKILEWFPSKKIFPTESKENNKQIIQYLKILQGNQITSLKFGKRWLKNSFKNYICKDFSNILNPIEKDVILAASGYSLTKQLDFLRKVQKSYFIAALPSSVMALKENGITPDLIITTDPGFYASIHYRTFPEEIPVAVPLSAYPLDINNPLIGINQMNELDRLIWKPGECTIEVPEMGTVAATALELLKKNSLSNIYILGLDLCMKDLREHVTPHAFDVYSTEKANRFSTEIQKKYERIKLLSVSRKEGYFFTKSMNTYSNWFSRNKYNHRITRVSPSPVALPIQEVNNLKPVSNLENKPIVFKKTQINDINLKKTEILAFLKSWISHIDEKEMTIDGKIDFNNLSLNYFGTKDVDTCTEQLVKIMKSLENL